MASARIGALDSNIVCARVPRLLDSFRIPLVGPSTCLVLEHGRACQQSVTFSLLGRCRRVFTTNVPPTHPWEGHLPTRAGPYFEGLRVSPPPCYRWVHYAFLIMSSSSSLSLLLLLLFALLVPFVIHGCDLQFHGVARLESISS